MYAKPSFRKLVSKKYATPSSLFAEFLARRGFVGFEALLCDKIT